MLVRYGATSRYNLTSNKKEASKKKVTAAIPYTTYVARDGDTFDMVAHKLLRDATRFWEIADINPHIKFPNKLVAGQVLRIPR